MISSLWKSRYANSSNFNGGGFPPNLITCKSQFASLCLFFLLVHVQTVCPQSTRPVETYFHLCTLWCLINHIISFTTSFQLLSIVDCDRLSQGHLSGISRRFVSFARRSRSLSWMATTALPLVDSSPPGVALVPQAPGATVNPPTNYAADSMSVRKLQCNWSTLAGSIVNQSPHRGWSTPLQTT